MSCIGKHKLDCSTGEMQKYKYNKPLLSPRKPNLIFYIILFLHLSSPFNLFSLELYLVLFATAFNPTVLLKVMFIFLFIFLY